MATNQGAVGGRKSEITKALPRACSDEAAAADFIEAMRWGDSPACPRCGTLEPTQLRDRKTGNRSARYLWRCKGCKKQFTVRTGTVLEDSKIPLKHWCYAFWAACASKKGVSALQIKRQTGLSYPSALFMMHRVRFAMADDYSKPDKLKGIVEVDETYVGGKLRYNPKKNIGRGMWEKAPVLAMIERDGNVRSFPVERVNSFTLQSALLKHVDRSATIMSDQHQGYPGIGSKFAGGHHTVNHSIREYARGNVTTNTVEGFFSLLKRGIVGTFHSVSVKHLHRYVSEFEFRHNTRKLEDGYRVGIAIRKGEGKRLTYKRQVAG